LVFIDLKPTSWSRVFLENLIVTPLVRKFLACVELQVLLSCTLKSAIGQYTELFEIRGSHGSEDVDVGLPGCFPV
jgi:hypothetical protein